MPNYTWNVIKANKEVIKGLLNKEGEFSFHTLVPVPEELELTTSGGIVDELVCLYILENFKYKDVKANADTIFKGFGTYCINLNKTKKENIKILQERLDGRTVDVIKDGWGEVVKVLREVSGKEYYDLQQKYGHHDWYSYHNEKWGTKWDAFEVDISDNEIHFTTAWAAPFPIFEKICEMFPKEEISFEAEYEDNWFVAAENNEGHLLITEEHEMHEIDEEVI